MVNTKFNLIDLFQPRLIVPSDDFQVVFIHFVYNSALFFGILLVFIIVTRRSQFDLYAFIYVYISVAKFLNSFLSRSLCYSTVLELP
jgi:hypothetical protein